MQPIGQRSICVYGLIVFLVGGWWGGMFMFFLFFKPSPSSVNKVLIVQASQGMCPHAFERKLKQHIKSLNNSTKVTFIYYYFPV